MNEEENKHGESEAPAAVSGEEEPTEAEASEPAPEAESLSMIKAAFESKLAKAEEEARKRAEAAQAALAERDELIAELLGDEAKGAPKTGPMGDLFARNQRMKKRY